MVTITIEFQKSRCEEEGLYTSRKEDKLHRAEAERNRANTLSTRLLVCCKTSTTSAAKVKKLTSGTIAQKFIVYPH
jgi:hypothetical protein